MVASRSASGAQGAETKGGPRRQARAIEILSTAPGPLFRTEGRGRLVRLADDRPGPPGPSCATRGLQRHPFGLRAQGAMPKRCHGPFMRERMAARGKDTAMRTLFLTTAAFAALVMIAPVGTAHATDGDAFWEAKKLAEIAHTLDAACPGSTPIPCSTPKAGASAARPGTNKCTKKELADIKWSHETTGWDAY